MNIYALFLGYARTDGSERLENDPENARNWSILYRGFIIFSISFGTLVVILYSTTYTTGISQMQHEFHIANEPIVTLGVTTYLVGVAVGSLLLAPLSEVYGRKWVYCANMALFVILVLPCAKATSMAVSALTLKYAV